MNEPQGVKNPPEKVFRYPPGIRGNTMKHAKVGKGPSPPKATLPPKVDLVSPRPRFSKEWILHKYARWGEQPRSAKVVEIIGIIFLGIILIQTSWVYFWGCFYYTFEYAKAALGHDVLMEPCARIMKEVYPWRHLETEEYWRWNRCVGNEHGFERQGNLVPTPQGFLGWFFNPYLFSSWMVSCFRPVLGKILWLIYRRESFA
jgi:hypothetical protein